MKNKTEMTRDEMIQIAADTYDSVRGDGAWSADKAWQSWEGDSYEYLPEAEIKARATTHALDRSREDYELAKTFAFSGGPACGDDLKPDAKREIFQNAIRAALASGEIENFENAAEMNDAIEELISRGYNE